MGNKLTDEAKAEAKLKKDQEKAAKAEEKKQKAEAKAEAKVNEAITQPRKVEFTFPKGFKPLPKLKNNFIISTRNIENFQKKK